MDLYDLTHPLGPGTPVFPGEPPVAVHTVCDLDRGDGYTARRLEMGSHAGTHVDAPAHLVRGGACLDMLPPGLWWGPAVAVRLHALDALALDGVERVLVAGSRDGLTLGQAERLAGAGVRLVGVEGPSVDPVRSRDLPAHRALLGAGAVVVENLRLEGVPLGPGVLACLPLSVAGGDGAPCRALWRPGESGG